MNDTSDVTPLSAAESRAAVDSSLRHVMVVGGSLDEWKSMSEHEWFERVDALGAFCSGLSVPWLTVRAYGQDRPHDSNLELWQRGVDSCVVIIDPCGDGRQRFAEAMQRLAPSDEVNEASVAATLYEPADSEPDLVVILGPPTQLPPSLVWELAYAELVFVDTPWIKFSVGDLERAFDDFAGRRRRFGGIDED